MPQGASVQRDQGCTELSPFMQREYTNPSHCARGQGAGCTEPGPCTGPCTEAGDGVRGREGQARGGAGGALPEEEGAVCRPPGEERRAACGPLTPAKRAREAAVPAGGGAWGGGKGKVRKGQREQGWGPCGRGREGRGTAPGRSAREGGGRVSRGGSPPHSPPSLVPGPQASHSGLAPWRTWTCPGSGSLRSTPDGSRKAGSGGLLVSRCH